jgi:PAS domain-containing protein
VTVDIEQLQRRIAALEAENARLAALAAADNSELKRAETALADSEHRYRTLFDSIDEGFCIIEFFDGPHGPLSDYIHIEANPAYALHAGIENVVGQKLREMVPGEADGWVELYGSVLRTGAPIRFERELVATGRYLELAAFRPGGINGRQLADAARTTRPDLRVLFITGYAENAIIGNGQLEPSMGVLTKPFVMETLARRIIEMSGDAG